jgi:hypothetical protein
MTYKIDRTKCLSPGCLLKLDSSGYWYSGNQVSTYEIVTRLCHQDTSINKQTREEWVHTMYRRVKSDPVRYGSYAGLNNWSPTFTETQLDAFLELIEEIIH